MSGRVRERFAGPGWRLGVRESLSLPGLMIAASYLGFGSLVSGTGLSLWLGLASTASGWALPGQIALVELYGTGASLAAITVAVWLTNARLLPMTITLMPVIDDRPQRGGPGWLPYLYAHLIAVTGWAVSMRRGPQLPPDQRLPFFLGLTLCLWLISLIATAAGWALAGRVPLSLTLALVLLNPLYFMLMLVEVRRRSWLIALIVGAALGPPLHELNPEWGLMLTGLIGGTAAWGLARHWPEWPRLPG